MTRPDELPAREDDIIERVRRHLEDAHRCNGHRELPFITMTYAQSLDGSIARSEGQTLQLSNPFSRKLTHQVRAIHDAILVGINTVIRDNPRLNVRLIDGKNPQPVVVDSRLRFPLQARLLRDPCVRPIIMASADASGENERRLADAGARVIRVPADEDGLLDLPELFSRLKQLGFRSVMVEGGATIITSILTSHLADQFLLTISPRFVGGLRAVQPQDEAASDRMPRLCNLQYQWLAEDLILRGDLDRGQPSHRSPLASRETSCDPAPLLDSSTHHGDAEGC